MNARFAAIGISIAKTGKKYKKFYGFQGQRLLLHQLNEYHDYEISERTLRRDLREMEANHLLKTLHRTRIDKCGKKVFTSNLYTLKRKFFNWLTSLEKLAADLFSHFHRPKMADYQVLQKRASLSQALAPVEILWISDSKGVPVPFNKDTGQPL